MCSSKLSKSTILDRINKYILLCKIYVLYTYYNVESTYCVTISLGHHQVTNANSCYIFFEQFMIFFCLVINVYNILLLNAYRCVVVPLSVFITGIIRKLLFFFFFIELIIGFISFGNTMIWRVLFV